MDLEESRRWIQMKVETTDSKKRKIHSGRTSSLSSVLDSLARRIQFESPAITIK